MDRFYEKNREVCGGDLAYSHLKKKKNLEQS